jgi:class 3 adenylate cyclase/tetratricopeptide (TPR) repeat protein
MKCPRCQHESSAGQGFCSECGISLALSCVACGSSSAPGAKFCGSCGESLGAGIRSVPRFASPESYTPRHLVERIINSKAALEGERKLVTVLFADLKGSMEILAERDPEEARKILDPVLKRMMEAVHQYEGTVNQVMGDGIMALFGAPVAHEDHAVRACYAALRMQESMKRYAEEARRTYGIPVQIRVGLNSGEVVVRSIGSDLRMDYSAVGQATHLAARMEQAALPGSIVITSDTLRLSEGRVEAKALGPVPVKGRSGPVELYELTGAGPSRTRFQASAARGLTRFVGREAELGQLQQALGRARGGHGQVIALVGEPGVGKSRLVWELSHSVRAQGWTVLGSGSVSYGKATPYLPVIELLKAYFRVEERDDSRTIREKLTGKVFSLDRMLESILPALLALLDVLYDDHEWQGLDPSQRRQLTLDAVKRLLLRESQVQPLLLVFEDLHWIDSETQALLDVLVDGLPLARIVLLVNYRPEYQHTWGNRITYDQLRLDTLPPTSAGVLLDALLGDHPSLQSLKRLLIGRTEGNPFFLEESIRALVETQALRGERGAYRLAKVLETTEMPVTVQAMLAARIDRLPPEEKQLLQCASVIGKDISHPILNAIAQVPEEDLRRHIDHLQAAEFLYETSIFPDLEYTFKHALTHEVAYGTLLQERRQEFHAQIVDAIERLYPDRLPQYVERLAHHAFCAESWERALAYLRQAGTRAFARASHLEAAGYFEKALAALKCLPRSRDRIEQTIDILFDLQLSLLPLGKLERGLDHLREADALAGPLNDARRSGRLYIYMTGQFYLMGDLERAFEIGQRALSIAETLGDFSLMVSTNAYLGQVYHALGDYRRAADFFRRNVKSLVGGLINERFGLPQLPSVHSRTCLVWSLAELGEFAEGIARGEESIRIAESVDQPFSLTVAYSGLGTLYLRRGDLPTAIPMLERGIKLSRSGNVPLWFPRIASDLGLAYALSGRLEEGLPLLEEAVEQAASMRLMVSQSLLVASLGEGQLLAGHIEEATELSQQALALSRHYTERGNEARALRLLGELALRGDPPDPDSAQEYYRQARALADQLAMRPLVAQSHLGLGRTYQGAADHAQAREHLTTAAELFRELAMPLWTGQAEAALVGSD